MKVPHKGDPCEHHLKTNHYAVLLGKIEVIQEVLKKIVSRSGEVGV